MGLTQGKLGATVRTSHGFCPLFDVDDPNRVFIIVVVLGMSQFTRCACNEWQHEYEVPMSCDYLFIYVHWGQLHGVACASLAKYK
jgi:hypothetical protein